MTQIMSLAEYLLYECNLMAKEHDIEVVLEHPERPRPYIVISDGKILEFPERPTQAKAESD